MYDIYITFKGTDNALKDWQKLLGGRIKGNTLHSSFYGARNQLKIIADIGIYTQLVRAIGIVEGDAQRSYQAVV